MPNPPTDLSTGQNPDPMLEAPPPGGSTPDRHPPGLFLLFFVEMWERFSYYGMRALLVLFLVTPTTGMVGEDRGFNPGRGWSEPSAYMLYGWYTGLAYLLPVFGGLLADKFLGTHRSMLLGGVIIALGHVVLAVSGIPAIDHSALGMPVFISGLALIIFGTGYFKPCVSVMVGQLYRQGDPRRDGGFSIFYMGINLGAFLCTFVCGTLGERVGWHWGFGSAAVGMLAGLALYLWGKPRFLAGIGDPPPNRPNIIAPLVIVTILASTLVGVAYHFSGFEASAREEAGRIALSDAAGAAPASASDQASSAQVAADTTTGEPASAIAPAAAPVAEAPPTADRGVPWALVGAFVVGLGVLGAAAWFVAIQRPEDRGPVASIFIFMGFNAFFWLAFEQAGSTLNVFAKESTDREIAGWTMPASWLQSVNPLVIILFSPLFAVMWQRLGRRKRTPSQPVKIALGLIFLGLGYVVMVAAAKVAEPGTAAATVAAAGKASVLFLVGCYFFHTIGELFLSPTGLSYVTKAAPVRFLSLLMGVWFISSFIANLGGGYVASYVVEIEEGRLFPPILGGRADFFLVFVVFSIGPAILILAATPLLKKLMRNPND